MKARLALMLLAACDDRVCNLELEAINLAGGDAINCGVVEFGDEAGPAKACVAEAFGSQAAFIIVKHLNEDGSRLTAMASDGTDVWQLIQTVAVGVSTEVTAWKCGTAAVSPIEADPLLVCEAPETGEERFSACPG